MCISVKLSPRPIRTFLFAVGAGFFVSVATPAAAQDGEYPSNQEQYPGQLVYSRDVPRGIATRRVAQGEANTVALDQSQLIKDSLLLGLEPISDADQAGVSAPLTRGLEVANQALSIGLSHVTGAERSNDFTRSESGASSTGSIISRGLSVLPSALSVISRTAGGGQ